MRRDRFDPSDEGILTSMSDARQESATPPSDATRAISRSIVGLLKEYLGRGPVKAKTYIHEDSVLVLMNNGHTTGEETLRGGGEAKAVASQRVKSSEAIHDKLTAVVEAEMGRKVVGFMSSSQQDPSLISYVFVLETTDLLDVQGASRIGTRSSADKPSPRLARLPRTRGSVSS